MLAELNNEESFHDPRTGLGIIVTVRRLQKGVL
jgi:hypothetical protein